MVNIYDFTCYYGVPRGGCVLVEEALCVILLCILCIVRKGVGGVEGRESKTS